MGVAALVLGAGRGERLGRGLPKAFVPVAGVPILLRSLDALAAVPEIERIVPVLPEGGMALFAELATAGLGVVAEPVVGGALRQDSVRAGLAALPPSTTLVAVHDAARCLVRPSDVSRVIESAREHGAAILATPAQDTIKRARGGVIVETPDRRECWAAQTPQVFAVDLLREALDKAAADGVVGTDDAQLVERLGVTVRIVEGDPGNLKITLPEDLLLAETRLREGRAS